MIQASVKDVVVVDRLHRQVVGRNLVDPIWLCNPVTFQARSQNGFLVKKNEESSLL